MFVIVAQDTTMKHLERGVFTSAFVVGKLINRKNDQNLVSSEHPNNINKVRLKRCA